MDGVGRDEVTPAVRTDAADPGARERIVFQGQSGAYSHLACRQVYPAFDAIPATNFEDALDAVRTGAVDLGMIPIENSVAGRVADIHHLMPKSGLFIIGEHFQRVNHQLLAVPGTRIEQLRTIHSHTHALQQCRNLFRELGIPPTVHADTAGAAREVAANGRHDQAAIASTLAAEIHGLEVLRSDIEDAAHNTTRFVILAREPVMPALGEGPVITSFLFRVRNVPAALYKALGGFATNGINMMKLESYLDGGFNQAQFFAEILGHPDERGVQYAFDELAFFSASLERFGTFPAHPFRFRDFRFR